MITLESIPALPDRGYAAEKLLRTAEDRKKLTLKSETHPRAWVECFQM